MEFAQTLRTLFDIQGAKITNLLEIKEDQSIFVATDRTYYRGLRFRDFEVPGSRHPLLELPGTSGIEKGSGHLTGEVLAQGEASNSI